MHEHHISVVINTVTLGMSNDKDKKNEVMEVSLYGLSHLCRISLKAQLYYFDENVST